MKINRAILLAMLALALVGCGEDTAANVDTPCGDGEAIEIDGSALCVYERSVVIERKDASRQLTALCKPLYISFATTCQHRRDGTRRCRLGNQGSGITVGAIDKNRLHGFIASLTTSGL